MINLKLLTKEAHKLGVFESSGHCQENSWVVNWRSVIMHVIDFIQVSLSAYHRII